LLKAAKASGFDVASMLCEHDTAVNCTRQYTGLTDFKLPSTEEIAACPADNFLVAALSCLVPRGRPSNKRLKGAMDFWGNKAKHDRLHKKKISGRAVHSTIYAQKPCPKYFAVATEMLEEP
jgi:hypothetical protein